MVVVFKTIELFVIFDEKVHFLCFFTRFSQRTRSYRVPYLLSTSNDSVSLTIHTEEWDSGKITHNERKQITSLELITLQNYFSLPEKLLASPPPLMRPAQERVASSFPAKFTH